MATGVYGKTYYLAAGEGTPERQLPVGLLFARCIEVATDHANSLGVGFENLMAHGQSWVLSRMVVEMTSYPKVNENYTVETWVDSFNRASSDRFFRILDARGEICGYARSTWVAIDMERRTLADISRFDSLRDAITTSRECPITPCGRHRPLGDDGHAAACHTFEYSDLDSNRHVNTVRYIEMLMNCWTPKFHAEFPLQRLEVSFMRECVYGEEATLSITLRSLLETEAELTVNGERRVHFAATFRAPELRD